MPKIAVLINDTRSDHHHGCDRVVESINTQCRKIGIKITATAPAHTDWRVNRQVVRAIETADLVIVNGEGTIHHDRPEGKVLLEVGAAAKQHGTPAVLINCTWQSNCENSLKALTNFEIVTVRESLSERELGIAGIQCRRVPDLSLDELDWANGSRQQVGIADSVVRSDQTWLHSRVKAIPSAVPCAILYPSPGLRGTWQFFRNYVAKSDLGQPSQLLDKLLDRFGQWRVSTDNGKDFLETISGLTLLIGGRFHATCLAMGVGTPFLALRSNSHKIEGMLRDAGLSERLISRDDVTEARIAQASSWTAQEREDLRDYLADAAERRASLFKSIETLLQSKS